MKIVLIVLFVLFLLVFFSDCRIFGRGCSFFKIDFLIEV